MGALVEGETPYCLHEEYCSAIQSDIRNVIKNFWFLRTRRAMERPRNDSITTHDTSTSPVCLTATRCGRCGQRFSISEWNGLPSIGTMSGLVLRNCHCGSTMSMPTSAAREKTPAAVPPECSANKTQTARTTDSLTNANPDNPSTFKNLGEVSCRSQTQSANLWMRLCALAGDELFRHDVASFQESHRATNLLW